MVLLVPGLKPPPPSNASCKTRAPGSRWASMAARQSLGTTSKPTAGTRATPACAARSPRAAAHSMTSISPVMSR